MKTKRKLAFVMVLCVLFSLIPSMNAYAINIGDKLGNVLNSDIKAYINGNRIPCYNVDNQTVVVVADLANYGFDVKWDGNNRTSSVTYNPNKAATPLSVKDNNNKPGTIAFPYVYTDIVAYVNGRPVNSFNIDGNLVIYFSALSPYGTFAWDGVARTTKFTASSNQPTQPTNPVNPGAPSIGDRLGDVLNSDIKAFINDNRIPCYNINNQTVVIVSDLKNYGFDVVWDGTRRISSVTYNPNKLATPVSVQNNTNTPGSVAFSYVYTDIKAYVNGQAVESYNLNGELAIFFNALTPYGSFKWEETSRSSKFYTNYSISGKISDNNGSAVNGASVILKNASGQQVATATSKSDGTYSFANVTQGSYTVEASANDYVKSSASVTVNQNKTAVNVTLQRNSVTISGTISDKATSKNLSGVRVNLKTASGTTVQFVYSRSNGAFTFTEVAPGSYYVEVEEEGYKTAKTSQFTATSNVANRNIALEVDAYTIDGRITSNSTNSGLAATVRLRDEAKKLIDTVTANSSGYYTFKDVPSGKYYIEAAMTNYTTDTTSVFTLSKNETNRNLSLVITGYTVSGRIYTYDSSYGAYNATVRLKNTYGTTIATAYTSSDGSYSFTGVSNGTYYVEASLSNYADKTSSAFTVSNYNSSAINLTLDRAGLSYTGTVYQPNSTTPVYNATVQLKNSSGSVIQTVYTDSYGYYNLTGITANAYYTIDFSHSTYGNYTITQFYMTSNQSKTVTLANKVAVTVYLQVPGGTAPYTPTGTLYFVFRNVNSPYDEYTYTTNSYYGTFNIPVGNYNVTLSSSSASGNQMSNITQQVPITSALSTVYITMQSTTFMFTGKITGSDTPSGLANARVTLTTLAGVTYKTSNLTGADGSFTISDVLEGTYDLTVTCAGYVEPVRATVHITTGRTTYNATLQKAVTP